MLLCAVVEFRGRGSLMLGIGRREEWVARAYIQMREAVKGCQNPRGNHPAGGEFADSSYPFRSAPTKGGPEGGVDVKAAEKVAGFSLIRVRSLCPLEVSVNLILARLRVLVAIRARSGKRCWDIW